jgi:hypothetical protein
MPLLVNSILFQRILEFLVALVGHLAIVPFDLFDENCEIGLDLKDQDIS